MNLFRKTVSMLLLQIVLSLVVAQCVLAAPTVRSASFNFSTIAVAYSDNSAKVFMRNPADVGKFIEVKNAYTYANTTFTKGNLPDGILTGVASVTVFGQDNILFHKKNNDVFVWESCVVDKSNNYGYTIRQLTKGIKSVQVGDSFILCLTSNNTLETYSIGMGFPTSKIPTNIKNVDIVKAVSGINFIVALNKSGAVQAWGTTSKGGNIVPAGLTSGVIDIAAGGWFALAVKTDGTVVKWGDKKAIADLPAKLTGMKSLSGIGGVGSSGGTGCILVQNKDGTFSVYGNLAIKDFKLKVAEADWTAAELSEMQSGAPAIVSIKSNEVELVTPEDLKQFSSPDMQLKLK